MLGILGNGKSFTQSAEAAANQRCGYYPMPMPAPQDGETPPPPLDIVLEIFDFG